MKHTSMVDSPPSWRKTLCSVLATYGCPICQQCFDIQSIERQALNEQDAFLRLSTAFLNYAAGLYSILSFAIAAPNAAIFFTLSRRIIDLWIAEEHFIELLSMTSGFAQRVEGVFNEKSGHPVILACFGNASEPTDLFLRLYRHACKIDSSVRGVGEFDGSYGEFLLDAVQLKTLIDSYGSPEETRG